MLYPSRYNHQVSVTTPEGDTHYIVCNLFLGSSSIVGKEVFELFRKAEKDGWLDEKSFSEETKAFFLERKLFLPDPLEEERFIAAAAGTYGDRTSIAAGLKGGQYGFIISLHCNLDCPYCFQKQKADSCGYLTISQIDRALDVIEESEKRVAAEAGLQNTIPKISITGGEPLLRNAASIKAVNYLIEQLDRRGWAFSITTNGTELSRFITNRTYNGRCRNIQVTLDGPRGVHDARRSFRGGKGSSFDRIVEGVDAALKAGWKLTLRVNLDMSNVSSIPELAVFVAQREWQQFENFYAYLSPVTDHGGIGGLDEMKDEADLLEAVLDMVERNPFVLGIFDIKHFRGFNYVKQMLIDRNPRYPVIYRCEASTGMFIFDPLGEVHVCLEAVGDSRLRVGRYDPVFKLDDVLFDRWRKRNVLQLEHCRDCKIRFVCAGGCTMESFNRRDGEYCMPFLKEMEMAWQYYVRNRPELFA